MPRSECLILDLRIRRLVRSDLSLPAFDESPAVLPTLYRIASLVAPSKSLSKSVAGTPYTLGRGTSIHAAGTSSAYWTAFHVAFAAP